MLWLQAILERYTSFIQIGDELSFGSGDYHVALFKKHGLYGWGSLLRIYFPRGSFDKDIYNDKYLLGLSSELKPKLDEIKQRLMLVGKDENIEITFDGHYAVSYDYKYLANYMLDSDLYDSLPKNVADFVKQYLPEAYKIFESNR